MAPKNAKRKLKIEEQKSKKKLKSNKINMDNQEPTTSGTSHNNAKRKSDEIENFQKKFGSNDVECLESRSINESPALISSLSPFKSNWQIQAKVLAKRPIHTWKNDKNSGKVFNMDLYDKSAQIRATVFNDLVDRFYDKIHCGKVYLISNADLKDAKKQYSSINNNFELMFSNDTEMIECDEKSESFPEVKMNFNLISELKKLSLNSLVNVIGICHEIRGLEEFVSKKNGKCLKKREIVIIDSSNEYISITMWNHDAENYDLNNIRAVISLYNVRISEFNGKKHITLNRDSDIKYNETISEAKNLSTWYENQNNDLIKEIFTSSEMNDGENIPIKNLYEISDKRMINIIGICYDIGNLKIFFSSKSDIELKKRNVTLVDQSETPIIVTLWNAEAKSFNNCYIDTVVAIKNGQIGEKDGKK